jgi:hypothetical protein
VQQCGSLEKDFHGPGGVADFLFFLLLSAGSLMCVAPFVSVHFFGSALTFVIVYVWAKRHSAAPMALFGVVRFPGAWLPYVLLAFSLLFGQSIEVDLLGMAVGHCYFFFADVWPALAAHRGWKMTRVVSTPRILYWLTGTLGDVDAREARLAEDERRRQERLEREAQDAEEERRRETQAVSNEQRQQQQEEEEIAQAIAAVEAFERQQQSEAPSVEPLGATEPPEPPSPTPPTTAQPQTSSPTPSSTLSPDDPSGPGPMSLQELRARRAQALAARLSSGNS